MYHLYFNMFLCGVTWYMLNINSLNSVTKNTAMWLYIVIVKNVQYERWGEMFDVVSATGTQKCRIIFRAYQNVDFEILNTVIRYKCHIDVRQLEIGFSVTPVTLVFQHKKQTNQIPFVLSSL